MSNFIAPLFALLVGTALGSFLNVVSMRYPDRGPVGRSACPHCHKQLRWYELIPLLSFIAQRGRCRHCHRELSRQYPVMELVMGLATSAIFSPLPTTPTAFGLALLEVGIVGVVLVLCVIDLKMFLLPDIFVGVLSVFVACHLLLQSFIAEFVLATPVFGIIIGAGFLALLWVITGGQGIGLGDVKLMIPLGALFGPAQTVALLFAAFIGGGLVASLLLALRRVTMKTAIPFGPFLAASALGLLLMPRLALTVAGALTDLSSAIGW